VFIYGGDNVYGDVKKGPEGKPQFLKGDMGRLQETYQILAQEPGFQQMRAQSTILPTWDDHDYGANDAGAEYPQREQAKALFLDFWQVPQGDPRRQRDGVYFSRTFGPEGQRVQVIMLDMRSFRSALKPTDERNAPGKERYVPDPDPAKTQLGAQQWAWLRQTLRQPAELRLLVSSIQVIADGHGWERWGLLPTERQRLYDLLAQTPGVILLSGDRHRGAFYRHQPSERGYPLLEMTSSSLNLPLAVDEEPGPLRLGPTYQQANYGLIEVDWGEGQVDLQLKDMQGATLARQQVKLDELSPSAP
jgi:alkaline phosphatase D